MVNYPRKGIVLGAAGLVAGVALGAMGMMSLRGGDGPYATSPPAAARSMGAASAPASTYVTAVSVHCEMAPILPAGGEGDGQVSLQAKAAGASAGEVGSLILTGKEAAAAGRPHDAEVSFLNACRNAAVLQEGNGIPIADAMYQLGRHYATVAAFGSPKAKEALQRAERLYSASLEGYRTRLGPAHEKTKFAQEGLVTVQHGTGTAVAGNAAPAAAAAAPVAPAPAPVAAPEPPAVPVAAAPTPASPAAPAAAKPAPAPAPAPQARTSAAPAPVKPPAAQAPAPAPARAEERPVAAPKAPVPESRPQPEATRQPAAEPPAQPQPRPRRAPARTATAEAPEDVAPPPPRTVRVVPQEPEFDAPPPPPRSSAMGGNAGEVPTAEGSAGDQ